MKDYYSDIDDAITYGVEPALDVPTDFDMEAIARDFYDEYTEGLGLSASNDSPDRFWAIVQKYYIGKNNQSYN